MPTNPYSIPTSVPNRATGTATVPLNQPVNVGPFPKAPLPSMPTPITPVRR